jgi:hypothetical protein
MVMMIEHFESGGGYMFPVLSVISVLSPGD